MAFNPSGAINGTISGNGDILKGESAFHTTISGSLPITQNATSGPTQGPGVPNKKHRHDDEEQGKLFVGGLSWDTAQDSLLQYFGRFGEVIDCVVMKNAETGRSRGFGFVTFSDPLNVDAVIASCPHTLDGRTIDPKSCNPRSLQKPKRSNYLPKIFLGGLPSSITETDLRSFFSQFGEVCEVVIMYDQEKKKSRGFGFLSFADELACSKAVSNHFVNIQNKQVEVKRAEPRTIQGGNSIQGKDVPTNMSTPQWPSIPNGHPRHPPPNYGVPNVPPPHTLRNHASVSLPPPQQTMHPGWGVTNPTVPPPTMQHTSLPNNPVMSPQTQPHPPPALFHTQYTSPSTTPSASPVMHNWLQPPPHAASAIRVTTTTPQPLVPHNSWTTKQHSATHNVVPTFASPLPVASPVHSTAQPSPYPGITSVYPPPTTPQPGFWGMVPVPVPTPPPTSQAMSVDPYASHHPHLPVTSTHTHQQSKVAYSQYGGIAVSAASVLAAPVPPPVSYPVYQQSPIAPVHPIVSMASPSHGKPYINTTGVEYYSHAGTINHNPAASHPGAAGHSNIGGILVASPVSANHFSQPSLGAVPGVATVQSNSDFNATINGSLGPQRGIIYNQPSQMPGYHPYRRM